MVRPTEANNPLSQNIDLEDAKGIREILEKIDSEIFTGWEDYESFKTNEIKDQILKFSKAIAQAICESFKKI
jgi:hypothetical protein